MRPCTSTNIHEGCEGNKYCFSLVESMEACREAGFRAIDLSFNTAAREGCPLSCDGTWETWVLEVRDEIERLGMTVPSCHAYSYLYDERTDRQEELVVRSIEAAGIIGIPNIVIHPFSVNDTHGYSRAKSLDDNIVVFKKYADVARPYGVTIAIENMVGIKEKPRFGSTSKDILELIQKFDDCIFGVCWDFGHGERSGNDTVEALRSFGSLLKVVHVHDWTLNGVGYDHTLPYLGRIDWKTVMPVLGEIGFAGSLNLEIQNFTKNLPREVRPKALKLSYSVACDLISRAGVEVE